MGSTHWVQYRIPLYVELNYRFLYAIIDIFEFE